MEPMLGLTLEKPKENQGFWLQPLKNLRKIKVLGSGSPMGGPKGVRAGLGTPILGPKTSKMLRNRSPCLRLARYSHYIDPTGSAEPLGCLLRPKTAKNGPLGPLRAPRALKGPIGPFLAVLGRGRHSRGSTDPVGSIWCQYRAKRSHGDLFQTNFYRIHSQTGSTWAP